MSWTFMGSLLATHTAVVVALLATMFLV